MRHILIIPLSLALVGCAMVTPIPPTEPSPTSILPLTTRPSLPKPTATLPPTPTSTLPVTQGLEVTLLWRYPAQEVVWDLAVGDLDGEGRDEVAAGSQDKNVYLLDSQGVLLWRYEAWAAIYCVTIADLEGDGRGEVLAGSDDNNLYALSHDGRLLWRYATGSRVTEVMAHDLDGDGVREVLLGSWDGHLYVLDSQGRLRWRRSIGGGATRVQVADLEGDGQVEIVVASEEGEVSGWSPGGERLWSRKLGGYLRQLEVGDLDDDGRKEIAVGSSRGFFYLLADQGQIIGSYDVGSSIPALEIATLEGRGWLLLGSGYSDGKVYLWGGEEKRWEFAVGKGVWAVSMTDLGGEPIFFAAGDDGVLYLLDRYGRLVGSHTVGGRIHDLLVRDVGGGGEVTLRSGSYIYRLDVHPGEGETTLPTAHPLASEVEFSPSEEEAVELLAVGDILLGRTVEERMNQYGEGYPFAATADLIRSADIAVGNLESPLSTLGEPIEKQFLFRAHPRHLSSLAGAGFDILSLANNHLLDFGEEAMKETLEGLREEGLFYVGAGLSEEEAYRPLLVEVKGVKIAFLAYAATRWKGSPELPTETQVAFAEPVKVRQRVARAREEADLVIVFMHLGTEYQERPDTEQLAVSQAAIEAGATLVIGHHPHVVQGTASYGGGFIAYSLGDFVFDMPWEEEGAMLRAFLSEEGLLGVEIIPVQIADGVQPRPLLDGEGKPIIHQVYP